MAAPLSVILGPAAAAAVPISVLTDSYKATHFLQYPGAKKMVAVSVGVAAFVLPPSLHVQCVRQQAIPCREFRM